MLKVRFFWTFRYRETSVDLREVSRNLNLTGKFSTRSICWLLGNKVDTRWVVWPHTAKAKSARLPPSLRKPENDIVFIWRPVKAATLDSGGPIVPENYFHGPHYFIFVVLLGHKKNAHLWSSFPLNFDIFFSIKIRYRHIGCWLSIPTKLSRMIYVPFCSVLSVPHK